MLGKPAVRSPPSTLGQPPRSATSSSTSALPKLPSRQQADSCYLHHPETKSGRPHPLHAQVEPSGGGRVSLTERVPRQWSGRKHSAREVPPRRVASGPPRQGQLWPPHEPARTASCAL